LSVTTDYWLKKAQAHDYQRINMDFAGGVAFGSDQGMFIQNWTEAVPGTFNNQLYSACGDINNNVIMHPAIAMGDNLTEGKTCVVTALWDWSPVASWDGGDHWPSWQTSDDGTGMGYFGEGGGCYGIGESKNVICGHHHDLASAAKISPYYFLLFSRGRSPPWFLSSATTMFLAFFTWSISSVVS
jgi:hypothetical protein